MSDFIATTRVIPSIAAVKEQLQGQLKLQAKVIAQMANPPLDKINITKNLIDVSSQLSQPNYGNTVASSSAGSFAGILKQQLQRTSEAARIAKTQHQAVSIGAEGSSIIDMVIAQQKAHVSFQYTVQLTNKLKTAAQEVLAMQV